MLKRFSISEFSNYILHHSFSTATFWMSLGIMLMNAGSFFYIFILARILTPSDYSILITSISIIGLIAVPMSILQLVLVSMVSEAKGLDEQGKITLIYSYFLKRIFLISVLLLVLFLLFSGSINSFFHFSKPTYLLLVVLISIVFFFLIFFRAILQGAFSFKKFAFSSFWEMFFRVSLVLLFSILSFGLFGALTAFLISQSLVLIYTYFTLKPLLKSAATKTSSEIETKEVFRIVTPAAFMILGLTSFYTSDILLVRHFFPEALYGSDASLYAGLSTLGKIIFFGNFGIASTLLPLTTERHTRSERSHKLFLVSLALEILICSFFIASYFLFPKFLLTILGQKEYLKASSLLGLFAIFISLHSLVYLVSNYLFSTKRLLSAYIVFTFALVQIIGISIFRRDLTQVIQTSILTSLILLIVLISYFSLKVKKIV